MEQPEGFVAQGKENKMRKLVKSLYGLKQAPKQWHQRFTNDMLKSKFDMKDMSLSDVILGIKITRTQDGLVPDLEYAVSKLSRYTSNPSVEHWKSITRLLRYLRYTREYGLHYGRYPAVIEGYSDANWTSDIKDSRSTICVYT
ncbi:hypothetical protein OSB04_un001120 [Centaurea solstitialis]|uniref:Reverse transcriptase Ty1/copia-type domain-containing protein n=1 Tax=Centaurea solstitialis TaxID=347529 RepID=A0AA38SBB5_9ASTR|nr:hypothetical protein OSB04_un001120 [Centaurea solstitialis]